MNRKHKWLGWGIVVAGVGVGCGSIEAGPEARADDAGAAATSAVSDAPATSEAAALEDGREDAALDAATDPIVEAGRDATSQDGGSDAATPDASTDSGPVDAGLPDGCAVNATPIIGSVICSGNVPTSYQPSLVCAPELHFASTYEASGDHTKAYPATVNFNAAGRSGAILVLSSYEAVDWTVNVGPAATLTKVIVLGYKGSTVTAPPGVAIDNQTPKSTRRCSYLVSASDLCVDYVRASTGGAVASMYGCYNATSFTFQ